MWPLVDHLKKRGVKVQFGTRAYDLDFRTEGETRTVTAIRANIDGKDDVIIVGANDVVFALTGSMTEGTAYGDMNTTPVLERGQHEPGDTSDWALWKNLAKKFLVFGKPEKFYGDTAKSMWESVTLTCKPSPFVEKLKELSVNDPYSGRTVTGGIITFTDSNWVLSVTSNRQPHFPDQPDDVLVVWVYALLMDKAGNSIKKPMPACTLRQTQAAGTDDVNAMLIVAATNSDTVCPHGSAGTNWCRPDSGCDDGRCNWPTHDNSASISGAPCTINAVGTYDRVGILRFEGHGGGKRDESTSNKQQWTHSRLPFFNAIDDERIRQRR